MSVKMERQACQSFVQWLQPKDGTRNLVSAFCHMLSITLISTSLVQLSWFQIIGGYCIPHLSVYTFFTFGYTEIEPPKTDTSIQDFNMPQMNFDYEVFNANPYSCITPKIVNIMRMIILFSFMAIIFALIGFFLDIIGPKSKIYDIIRRNALPGACTFLWILVITVLCCSIQNSIEDSLKEDYPEAVVDYDYGFYTIGAAALAALFGVGSNLLCTYIPRGREDLDQGLLGNNWEDVETFSLPPPPPYSAPPPPYTP